ncbi:MAG: DUF4139 domain-containing protein [Candidatus Omnitrophica bacterium]|nr:DUF4139 domain-containing protein [Candidatus Omnitrophota bacterium]
MKKILIICFVLLGFSSGASAKVDLVTLPNRDSVQLTIYNSADLTLARENRVLTLREGLNALQFSWENTLIDPTSLDLLPQKNADRIDVQYLTFPPRVKHIGLWNIHSQLKGDVPVEINYLTSGLSWRAFYLATLTPDERSMQLKGYVLVTNNSGEDYENAKVRLIVGKVHVIDQIAALASKDYPYGRPDELTRKQVLYDEPPRTVSRGKALFADMVMESEALAPKEILKEGLSEYFLYTIEGRETIPNGWSKRLPSFEAASVPVENLYKYNESQYGRQVIHFLSFKNDEEHKLGDTPIPGGMIRVYRSIDRQGHLVYTGQSNFKYIPVDEDVALNLGADQEVIVDSVLMKEESDNFRYDSSDNIIGWDEKKTYQVEIKNTKNFPAKVEYTHVIPSVYWKTKNSGDYGVYEKVDAQTVKYTHVLNPKEVKVFQFEQVINQGNRARR